MYIYIYIYIYIYVYIHTERNWIMYHVSCMYYIFTKPTYASLVFSRLCFIAVAEGKIGQTTYINGKKMLQ